MTKRLWLLILLLSGCGTFNDTTMNGLNNTTVAVNAAPVASLYGSAYLSNDAIQATSISAGMSPTHYSKEVTKSQLFETARSHGWKFNEPWKYMGTKDGYHYLALYPAFGFRQIFRIRTDEYEIDDMFNLTSITLKWRDIKIFKYNEGEYPILIQQTNGYKPLVNNLYDNQFVYEYSPLNLGNDNDLYTIKRPKLLQMRE